MQSAIVLYEKGWDKQIVGVYANYTEIGIAKDTYKNPHAHIFETEHIQVHLNKILYLKLNSHNALLWVQKSTHDKNKKLMGFTRYSVIKSQNNVENIIKSYRVLLNNGIDRDNALDILKISY